jgi:mannose-6-phosphate isomerase-like protein (cupin superfamily)
MSALLALLFVIPLAQAKPAAPPPQAPPPQAPPAQTKPAPSPRRSPAAPAATAILQARVTNRSGTPIEGAQVIAEGPTPRDGVTDKDGVVVFRTMQAGTYRVRAANDEYVTLEKETAVRTGATNAIDFALARDLSAPPPPPPAPVEAPPPPPPAAPKVMAGAPRILSVPDLAEKSLDGRDPVRTVTIGCSGVSNSQLLVVRDSMQVPAQADADVTLYVVAGEAMLNLGGRQQAITSGWFSVVPRGTPHTITRRGRNPAILLSVVAGPICGE